MVKLWYIYMSLLGPKKSLMDNAYVYRIEYLLFGELDTEFLSR